MCEAGSGIKISLHSVDSFISFGRELPKRTSLTEEEMMIRHNNIFMELVLEQFCALSLTSQTDFAQQLDFFLSPMAPFTAADIAILECFAKRSTIHAVGASLYHFPRINHSGTVSEAYLDFLENIPQFEGWCFMETCESEDEIPRAAWALFWVSF